MKKTSKVKKLSFGKKFFPTFISSVPHQKNIMKKTLIFTIYVGIALFLLFNIFSSQTVHPSYFQLVNNDQKAATYYLQSTQKFPQYNTELLNFKNIYGKSLEDSLTTEETAKKSMIQNFEQVLSKNQYARDILYSLFLISGRQDYLLRAKSVDPDFNK